MRTSSPAVQESRNAADDPTKITAEERAAASASGPETVSPGETAPPSVGRTRGSASPPAPRKVEAGATHRSVRDPYAVVAKSTARIARFAGKGLMPNPPCVSEA